MISFWAIAYGPRPTCSLCQFVWHHQTRITRRVTSDYCNSPRILEMVSLKDFPQKVFVCTVYMSNKSGFPPGPTNIWYVMFHVNITKTHHIQQHIEYSRFGWSDSVGNELNSIPLGVGACTYICACIRYYAYTELHFLTKIRNATSDYSLAISKTLTLLFCTL